MESSLKDSKEIHEAASLFNVLLASDLVDIAKHQTVANDGENSGSFKKGQESSRGDQLENVLYGMCKRGGFQGAAIADEQGFALATYNSPVEERFLAAFATVLGDAMGKAGRFLDQHNANTISLDINYMDKAVVRKFSAGGNTFFIMVICAQEIDERGEVELSIEQIINVLENR